MTENQIIAALPALQQLNAWARLPYEQRGEMWSAERAVYWLKNQIIKAAMGLGLCASRIVAVERPCRTCKASGTYEWIDWHDEDHREYQDCRRCGATGKVILRFVETRIGTTTFHTPRPRAEFLKIPAEQWERADATDWTPERPGRPLDFWGLLLALNVVEHAVVGDGIIRYDDYGLHPLRYQLQLGTIRRCWGCGETLTAHEADGRTRYFWEVIRPGITWKQTACYVCDRASRWGRFPLAWPASYGRHLGDYIPRWLPCVPMPREARDRHVMEWLARRGIDLDRRPPGEYARWRADGPWVSIVAQRGAVAWVQVRDSGHFLHMGYGSDVVLLPVPADELRAVRIRLLPAPARTSPT